MPESGRAHWGSRFGFILAAAGSAVGLGNIWKFPYITGENGGGWFVLIYLVCIALVGLPIMMAEIFIGRTAQRAPVGAFKELSTRNSPWVLGGWLGVLTAFVVLSFYSVVAGWSMHYVWLSISGGYTGFGDDPTVRADKIGALFTDKVFANNGVNLLWHVIFMAITIAIVIGGIKNGVERAAKILMPVLMLLMIVLLYQAWTMDGFSKAAEFVFKPDSDKFHGAASVLEALGHAFFTLSLGMGAMITYGSYLQRKDDLVTTSVTVAVLDTVIALMACMVLFPIIFTFDISASGGPGLVFVSLPLAFSGMPGGAIWGVVFFVLLTFAALTSAISLLEVAVSYFIDERGWSRPFATISCGAVILLLGIPSALSGGTEFFGSGLAEKSEVVFGEGNGKNWFDIFDYVSSNWMLPLGGLAIALFVAWRVGDQAREEGFRAGTKFGALYWGWVQLLRYIVPIAVILVFLNLIGVLDPVFESFESAEAAETATE